MATTLEQNSTAKPEGEFSLDELFFSHTDKRGVIQSGNDVFVRVSGYQEAELVGKPHNTIRSPFMPRAVFKLFWSQLQADKSIVAYVVNKSKCGAPYWVLALAFPWKGGYLSIRLKPTSPLLSTVTNIYKRALEIEIASTPEKGLEFIIAEIKSLGFPDYNSFMIHALQSELISRYDLLKKQSSSAILDRRPTTIEQMFNAVINLEKLAHKVQTEFKHLNFLCINLSAYAEKYGSSGATTAVISDRFGIWGNETAKVIAEFVGKQVELQKCLKESRMAIACASVQIEMARVFANTKNGSQLYIDGLNALGSENQDKVSQLLQLLNTFFGNFEGSLQNMRESVMAMRIIRLSSRIEASHLPDEGKMIESIVENVTGFVMGIEKQIEKIDHISEQARQHLHELAT